MAPLGPFEPHPTLAVAVSGGADSMALAVLARRWAVARGGRVVGLIVDHALRPTSGAEAALTRDRLAALGIAAEILPLTDLMRGTALAARARQARFATLEAACVSRGILHLLLAHHAADQAETTALRMLDRSGPAGLAGMAALVERPGVRLLRPVLTVPPVAFRAVLREAGVPWVDDPSNQDPRAQRNRLRNLRGDADGKGPVIRAAVRAATWRGQARTATEAATAAWLGAHATIRPEGFAVVPRAIPPAPLAALLRCLAGLAYPPSVDAWCADPRAATLAGVRILPAGRLGPDAWLLAREAAAMEAEVPCVTGALWDRRFRVLAAPALPGLSIGALGAAAAGLRKQSDLPAAVLQTLPAIRLNGRLFAVPHLGYGDGSGLGEVRLVFAPAQPASGAGFLAADAEVADEGLRTDTPQPM